MRKSGYQPAVAFTNRVKLHIMMSSRSLLRRPSMLAAWDSLGFKSFKTVFASAGLCLYNRTAPMLYVFRN